MTSDVSPEAKRHKHGSTIKPGQDLRSLKQARRGSIRVCENLNKRRDELERELEGVKRQQRLSSTNACVAVIRAATASRAMSLGSSLLSESISPKVCNSIGAVMYAEGYQASEGEEWLGEIMQGNIQTINSMTDSQIARAGQVISTMLFTLSTDNVKTILEQAVQRKDQTQSFRDLYQATKDADERSDSWFNTALNDGSIIEGSNEDVIRAASGVRLDGEDDGG